MKTSSKAGEDYIKLLPSKVTEIYHREIEYINKELEDDQQVMQAIFKTC